MEPTLPAEKQVLQRLLPAIHSEINFYLNP